MKRTLYKLEKLTDELRREIVPILEQHRQDLSKYDDMPLNPDWELYYALDRVDRLRIFTARCVLTGELLGYAVFFLQRNPHYKDYVYAMQDVFYVIRDKRGSRIAFNLIHFTDVELEKDSVSVIVHHVKLINRFGEMLSKAGYHIAEHMYHKRIG